MKLYDPIMPKQDGRLVTSEKSLEVYLENNNVTNEVFKGSNEKIADISKKSAKLNDGPALLKTK